MTNDALKPRSQPLAVGDTAPDFELTDQHRQPWKLSDACKKGDVVLCFFPMAFTSVCGTEMECITKEMANWKARGIQVVGVSTDSFAVLKAWADQMGYKHPLLADMHRAVSKAYGLFWPELNVSSRGTLVVGKDGKVKFSQKREPSKAMDFDEVLASVA